MLEFPRDTGNRKVETLRLNNNVTPSGVEAGKITVLPDFGDWPSFE